ncbi:Aldose 1-epimerase [Phytophthora megakarya]|uniref:glucose-6-phosphate 1-epimerase n=1 Tax=Phytophthora megakarya TaxID=4795 RepID=A0A225VW96_9STRA|nr:Aldose 1-epimerase [Phytophthora megakarya]
MPSFSSLAAFAACLVASASAELPTTKLTHPSGSNAEVFLFGAHVKSFRTAQSPTRDVIFMSNHSYLDGVKPLMGGIPVVFPNFGSATGLPGHGFARVTNWTLTGVEEAADAAGSTVATFTMAASDATRKMWPVDFELEYKVSLSANQLETALVVHNTFTKEIDFHALLHNYIYVDDVRNGNTKVAGLADLEYFDKVGQVNKTQTGDLSITAETDSIYYNAPDTLTVSSKGVNAADRTVTIKKSGVIGTEAQATDAVIWNPWVERSKTFKDFGAEEYINMLAVEPGRVSQKQVLPAGQTYTLQQTITVAEN